MDWNESSKVGEVDVEWDAGRWVEQLSLRERVGQHVLEGLHRTLGGDDGGEEALGVHVAVAHWDYVPCPQQAGQLHGVLLPGDEGEVGREELLHDGRDYHVGTQRLLLQEGPVVHAVRLVVHKPLGVFLFFLEEEHDVAVLRPLPWGPQHGPRGGQYADAAAVAVGGLPGLQVGDVAEWGGQRGQDGARVGGGDDGKVGGGGGELGQGARVAVVVEALRDEEQVDPRRLQHILDAQVLEALLGGVEEPWRAEVEVAGEDGVDQDARAADLPHPAVDLQVCQLHLPLPLPLALRYTGAAASDSDGYRSGSLRQRGGGEGSPAAAAPAY